MSCGLLQLRASQFEQRLECNHGPATAHATAPPRLPVPSLMQLPPLPLPLPLPLQLPLRLCHCPCTCPHCTCLGQCFRLCKLPGSLFAPAWPVRATLPVPLSTIDYKGDDDTGYSMCCAFVNGAECEWYETAEGLKAQRVVRCPLNEELDEETLRAFTEGTRPVVTGAVVKPLHTLTPGLWEAKLRLLDGFGGAYGEVTTWVKVDESFVTPPVQQRLPVVVVEEGPDRGSGTASPKGDPLAAPQGTEPASPEGTDTTSTGSPQVTHTAHPRGTGSAPPADPTSEGRDVGQAEGTASAPTADEPLQRPQAQSSDEL